MRLKNLTIKGFKSFANETSLNFDDDVIGVVGPNGSGKSNVVDAIRWVLGEQKSKDLRLERMSDVIFNGTSKRKPANSASVTLTFENDKGLIPSEYNTVAISRVLYRSGESEYMLNGVACRLKDITTLLMDTGIGSNSYAIIALGMVDEILADKDNSRRRMFEQAAGISKYNRRKKETLSKLKGTTADLHRIEDLLFEIQNNLKSLEKQARRAKKYLKIKDQYKDWSILLAKSSIKSLKETYKELDKNLKRHQDEYNRLDVILRKKEAEIEAEKTKSLKKEQELSAKQKKLNALVNKIREGESEKSLLEQKKIFKNTNIEALKKAVKSGKKEMETLEVEIKKMKEKYTHEEKKLASLQKEKEKLDKDYNEIKKAHKSAKIKFDAQAKQKEQLNREIYDLEKSQALLRNDITNIKSDLERKSLEIEAKKTAYKKVKEQYTILENQIISKKKKIALAQRKEEDRKAKIEALRKQIDQIRDKLIETNRMIDSKQNEYDLLKSMIDSFEGFPESIKFLSTQWKRDIPILSDLLDVKSQYKGLIEQYLAPYLNYYVVDHIGQAKGAINLLAKSQKGKANFFLLDRVIPKKTEKPSFFDALVAMSVVNVDAKYEGLLSQLLHNVIIYKGSLDDIEKMDFPNTYTYLSSEGTYLIGKNYVGGGSVGLFEGKKIGRRKTLEKLSKELAVHIKESKKISLDLEELESQLKILLADDFSESLKGLQKEVHILEQEMAGATMKINIFKKDRKEYKTYDEKRKQTISAKEDELLSTNNALKEAKMRLKKMAENASDAGDIDEMTKSLSYITQKYNESKIAYIQQENLLSNLSKDIDFNQSKVYTIERSIKQDKIRRKDEQAAIENIDSQISKLDKDLIRLYEEKKNSEYLLSEEEQRYFDARNKINDLEDEVRTITRGQNQIQLKVQQIRDKFTDVKFQISTIGERLKIEFGLSINDFVNDEIEEEVDREELQRKVEKLKMKLSNYGEVNPLAVEAYDEMNERYHTITAQRQDIIDAKDSLLQTIKEIETTASKMYLDAFDKVRGNFKEVFRTLFSEDDDCDLILEDEQHPLESKIDIIAKPKGKKPKSLSQLSGGEKTLTAIALLFALYLLKPAPFCIFDEVDAPLDDANIRKFNKIIYDFSKKSQFIIVTHNKSTMEAVDILYGVFMAEMGVSQVAPVDFTSLGRVH